MKRVVLLLAAVVGVSACAPYQYNNGYYPNNYENYDRFNPHFNQQMQPSYQSGYSDDLSDIGYNENATIDPYQATSEQPMMYPNPGAVAVTNLQQPYPVQPNRGVVGVGETLKPQMPQHPNQYNNSDNKLIMPNAWRMAHPSVGKGLELANQAERFELNKALSAVNTKNPMDVQIANMNITVLSLVNSSITNSRGLLCKEVYLLTPNNNGIQKMWSLFCRQPNWNEWVLTKW